MAASRFSDFCSFLESLSEPFKTQKAKNQVLRNFLAPLTTVDDRFCVARLAIPAVDLQRGNYGLKEIALGKLLAEVFALPKKDADTLKHFRDPTYLEDIPGARAGEFSSVAAAVLAPRLVPIPPSPTLAEVNSFLGQLVSLQSQLPERGAAFASFVRRLSAVEIRWLIRIILKDLKTGVSPQRFLGVMDPRASDIFLTVSDLKKTIELIDQVDTNRQESSSTAACLRLHHPFKPMLAQRIDTRTVPDLFNGKLKANSIFPLGKNESDAIKFFVEPKYDGERILAHMEGERVEFYTRRANDYSEIYGMVLRKPLIDAVSGHMAILDGEVLVRNIKLNSFEPFGRNRSVAQNETEDLKLVYVLFDIVAYAGKLGSPLTDLTATPFSERRRLLERVVKPPVDKGAVLITASVLMSTANAVEAAIAKVQQEKKEGLILKHPASLYNFNARNGGWWKLKPTLGALADTLDLLVIGAYFGDSAGRRTATSSDWADHVTTFLLGVTDGDNRAKSFCKVGTGYNMAELAELRRWVAANCCVRYAGPHSAPFLSASHRFGPGEKPDFVLRDLKAAVVMEVQGAEIVPSTSFDMQWTLRFPRAVRHMRTDKGLGDAMTADELTALALATRPLAKDLKLQVKGEGGAVDSEEEERRAGKLSKKSPAA